MNMNAQPALLDPMVPSPCVVRRVRRDTRDTFTLELSHSDHRPFPPYSPGQFNMLYLFGVGEVPVSISGDAAEPEALAHTIRAVGTVTKAMRALKRGDALGVRGPFGEPWPLGKADGKDVMIVAGGVGLAPLRPALIRIASGRSRFGKVVLLYGARTPEDMLYARELKVWPKRAGIDVFTTVDRATRGWSGNVGVVTRLIPKAPVDPRNAAAFVCGPEVMMRFTVAELQRRGLDPGSIYVSLERNMKCAVGFCGHCQLGPEFICKNGPVFPYNRVKNWISRAEA